MSFYCGSSWISAGHKAGWWQVAGLLCVLALWPLRWTLLQRSRQKGTLTPRAVARLVFLRGSHDNKDAARVPTPEEEQVDHQRGASGVKLAVVFFTTAQQLDRSGIYLIYLSTPN